jgi:transcriptional regulator with XRE-family HTH domain
MSILQTVYTIDIHLKDNYLLGANGRDTVKNSPDLVAFYKHLGENIRTNRQRLNLSQDELARSVGLTRTSLTNIENGRQHPPLHTFCEIAQRLKVDPSALLPSRAEPLPAPDVKAIAQKQVRGENELDFIAAAIGIKNEVTPHDYTQKKNRVSSRRTLGGKQDQGSARKGRQNREG